MDRVRGERILPRVPTPNREGLRAGVDRIAAISNTGHRTEAAFERYNITDASDGKDTLIRVGQYTE